MKQPDFNKGLVPAIIQDESTGQILMLGYMDKEAYWQTLATGFVYFWSRRRRRLWKKGETSGNTMSVGTLYVDCDADTILIKVTLNGKAACHTGSFSCFRYQLI